MKCANCNAELKKISTQQGIYYFCPSCGGRMVTVPVLKREHIDPEILRQIRSQEEDASTIITKKCPQCYRPMKKVHVTSSSNKLELEICHKCFCVWFDKNEHDQLPIEAKKKNIEPKLHPKSREAYADFVIDSMAEQRNALALFEDDGTGKLEALMGILGLPFEDNDELSNKIPWISYGLTGIFILFFLFTKLEQQDMLRLLGFVPAELLMNGGLNIITSFFLHHNILQLIINSYFLVIFGDNVEIKLGIKKFILLLFISHIVGLFTESVLAPNYQGYILGPSAGIAGVVAFYTIAYPRAKIGIAGILTPLLKTWVPVLSFFVGLLGTQIYLAISKPAFASYYGFISHIGGAVVGLIFAFFWKQQQETNYNK